MGFEPTTPGLKVRRSNRSTSDISTARAALPTAHDHRRPTEESGPPRPRPFDTVRLEDLTPGVVVRGFRVDNHPVEIKDKCIYHPVHISICTILRLMLGNLVVAQFEIRSVILSRSASLTINSAKNLVGWG